MLAGAAASVADAAPRGTADAAVDVWLSFATPCSTTPELTSPSGTTSAVALLLARALRFRAISFALSYTSPAASFVDRVYGPPARVEYQTECSSDVRPRKVSPSLVALRKYSTRSFMKGFGFGDAFLHTKSVGRFNSCCEVY